MKSLFKLSVLLLFTCLLFQVRVQGAGYYLADEDDDLTPTQQLNKAISNFDVEMARLALENGAEASSEKIESILLYFSIKSMTSMGLYAEEAPPDVYATVSIVKMLIDAGADVNKTRSGGMPLLIAALNAASSNIDDTDKNRVLVKVLLDAGVDVNVSHSMEDAISGDGSKARIRPYCPNTISALCMAACYMDAEIVEQILKAGNADVEEIDNAIGIAENRILERHKHSVISVLKRYREAATKAAEEEEPKTQTTITITKTEPPASNQYVLYGAIGCGVLLLIVIVVLANNGGGSRSVILSSGLSKNKIAGPKVSSLSQQRRSQRSAVVPAPRVPHHVHPAPAVATPPMAAPPQKLYQVYMPDGSTAGPYTVSELRTYLQTGALSVESLVWTEGMSDWMPLGNVLGY